MYQRFGGPAAKRCGVLNKDGVYYASLRLQGKDDPFEVALHGVRSEIEARQALATLITLPGADCSEAKP